MESQNRFNIKYGCVAERSKAPDSRYLILTNVNWEHSGIVRCKSSNLFATIIFCVFSTFFFFSSSKLLFSSGSGSSGSSSSSSRA